MPKATAGGTVVLLHGEERFLVEEKARAVVTDWQKDLISDFGFEPMEAAGLTAARLQDSVLQAPFLDPFRAVWVRGVVAARARLPDGSALATSWSRRSSPRGEGPRNPHG